MKISLINSEQYFKRKDLRSIPWFALPNNILEHPDFFDISGNEFKAFIWIVGVAAKCKKFEFDLDLKHAAYMTKASESEFRSCLEKLNGKRLQVAENIKDVTSSLRVRNGSVPNITEHNKTKQNKLIEKYNISSEATNSLTEAEKVQSFYFKISDDLKIPISHDVMKAWSDTYPAEFLTEELKKARNWLLVNPSKRPKTAFTRFFNNWLGRGWESYRKTLKSNSGALSEEMVSKILQD